MGSGFIMILCIGAAIFAYKIPKLLLGVSPIDGLVVLWRILFGKTNDAVVKVNASMRARTERMSRSAKKKSWTYKYQTLLNDILLDLGWKQMGVTIEGLTIMILILTIIIDAVCYLALRSFIGIFLFGAGAYIVVVAAMFSLSRGAHRRRKALLIAAEDLLCANMSKGITNAIRENVEQFDPEIRDDFRAYLNDVDCNMPTIEAIDRLNERLGSKFDNFCEKAKDITENYQPGAEDNFLFNITSNAIETELDNEIYEANANANMDYFATLVLLVIFFFVTNGMYGNMTEFYFRGAGRILLVLYIMVAIAVYIYTQWQGSRRT